VAQLGECRAVQNPDAPAAVSEKQAPRELPGGADYLIKAFLFVIDPPRLRRWAHHLNVANWNPDLFMRRVEALRSVNLDIGVS